MDLEFKAYKKIPRQANMQMTITQKIHGTNAQIYVFEDEAGKFDLRCGSRNRWLFPDDDNFGFATFVHKHKDEFIEKLGLGTHYGEWAGPGINSGEGLKEKTFVLFEWYKFPEEAPLPPNTVLVPVLYQGKLDTNKIDEVMAELKANGSKLAPGFMGVEGVVVDFGNGQKMKNVFLDEETEWRKGSGIKNKGQNKKPQIDYSHLCQPVRLEKLLSKDQRLLTGYPETLPDIVKQYVGDLIDEGQIAGDEDQVKAIKKGATGQIFKFIKEFATEKGM